MAKVKTKYRNGGMVEKNSVLGWIADIIIYALLIVMMFICVIPLWYSLVASFSDGFTLYNSEGMIWFPVGNGRLRAMSMSLLPTTSCAGTSIPSSMSSARRCSALSSTCLRAMS